MYRVDWVYSGSGVLTGSSKHGLAFTESHHFPALMCHCLPHTHTIISKCSHCAAVHSVCMCKCCMCVLYTSFAYSTRSIWGQAINNQHHLCLRYLVISNSNTGWEFFSHVLLVGHCYYRPVQYGRREQHTKS